MSFEYWLLSKRAAPSSDIVLQSRLACSMRLTTRKVAAIVAHVTLRLDAFHFIWSLRSPELRRSGWSYLLCLFSDESDYYFTLLILRWAFDSQVSKSSKLLHQDICSLATCLCSHCFQPNYCHWQLGKDLQDTRRIHLWSHVSMQRCLVVASAWTTLTRIDTWSNLHSYILIPSKPYVAKGVVSWIDEHCWSLSLNDTWCDYSVDQWLIYKTCDFSSR